MVSDSRKLHTHQEVDSQSQRDREETLRQCRQVSSLFVHANSNAFNV